jgi:hypothetical protein
LQEYEQLRTCRFIVCGDGNVPHNWILVYVEDADFAAREMMNAYSDVSNGRLAQPTRVYRSSIRIGDLSIGLSATSANDIHLTSELGAFRTESSLCDIEIMIEWAEQLEKLELKRLFDSGALWTLYAEPAGLVFDFATAVLGSQPYKRLRVNRDFSRARLFLNREYFSQIASVSPLEYPLDELLITNWLSCGKGVEVHACGLVDLETGGHLFLGHSGAGKSTTTLLWKKLRDVRVLSDDRIILRKHANEIWMHGTPWHGEAGFASPEKARIRRIFILEHGEKNEILRLSNSEAVAELFVRSFPPFHGREALDSTVSYLDNITNSIVCYRYRFLPNLSAVEEILNFHG